MSVDFNFLNICISVTFQSVKEEKRNETQQEQEQQRDIVMTLITRVPQKELVPRRIAPSSIVWAVEYLENLNCGHKKELSS